MTNPTPRRLECSVCASDAGRFRQWWNRDTGYGLCAGCRDWLLTRSTPAAEMRDLYGIEGVHYPARVETITTMGRRFAITAIFTSVDEANAYMAKHAGQAVIETRGELILLADKNDNGVPSTGA